MDQDLERLRSIKSFAEHRFELTQGQTPNGDLRAQHVGCD